MGRDSTLTGRTEIWSRVIHLVPNPVVGTGFESFWLGRRLEIMDDYQQSLNEAHNGFLEIWASLGWVGTIILLTMIAVAYREIISQFRRNPDAARLRMAYFLTVIVTSFTEAAFRTVSVFWFAFLLVIMTKPRGRVKQPRKNSTVVNVCEHTPVMDRSLQEGLYTLSQYSA